MRLSFSSILAYLLLHNTYSFSQSIIINEVQFNPCCGSIPQYQREWIELQNLSLIDTFDLTDYFLRTDLNNNLSAPIYGDVRIVCWETRNSGTMPLVSSNSYALKTNTSKILPGEIVLIIDPTWNSYSSGLIALPDSCKIYTIESTLNFGADGAGPPDNGLLNNVEDIIFLYDGDPALSQSVLIDSLSWKNSAQQGDYTLQRDNDCLFKWHNDAANSSTGGYNADFDKSIISMQSPGLPNFNDTFSKAIVGPDTICYGEIASFEYVFSSDCRPYFISWDFGDVKSGIQNYTSHQSQVTHMFSDSGTYNITMIFKMGQINDTLNKSIYVSMPPSVFLGNDTSICNPNKITLNAGAGNYTYLWQNGDSSQFYQVDSHGVYYVEVQNEMGCSSYDTILINYSEAPKLDLGNDTLLCSYKDSLELNAGIGYASYAWSNGSHNYSILVNQTGTYSVIATDSNGCISSDSVLIKVNSIASVFIGNDTSLCSDNSLILYAGPNYSLYKWSTLESDSSITVYLAGSYYVDVTDLNGCPSSDTIQLSNYSTLKIDLGQDINICNGDSVEINAGSDYTSYLWSTGELSSSIYIDSASTCSVIVKDKNGCESLDTVLISISPLPLVSFYFNPICEGDTVYFINQSGGESYTWNFGDQTYSNDLAPNHIYETAGTYSIKLVAIDHHACRDSSSQTINIYPIPDVSFLSNTKEGCPNLSVEFYNTTLDAVTYLWDFGNGDFSTEENPAYLFTQSGFYDVSLSATNSYGCSNNYTSVQYIQIFPIPQAHFESSEQMMDILSSSVYFTDLSIDATSWIWDFDDGETGTDQNPQHIFKDTGTFEVLLTVLNNYECADTSTQQISIGDVHTFYIPTSFTPNGDGKNDYFFPKGIGINYETFQMEIFNRWGNLLFQANDFERGWDGKKGSQYAKEDTYIWQIYFKELSGKKHYYTGNVNLIR
jgi:gliding motility-associated-like protein